MQLQELTNKGHVLGRLCAVVEKICEVHKCGQVNPALVATQPFSMTRQFVLAAQQRNKQYDQLLGEIVDQIDDVTEPLPKHLNQKEAGNFHIAYTMQKLVLNEKKNQ